VIFRLAVEASGVLPSQDIVELAEREYAEALNKAGELVERRIKQAFQDDGINASGDTAEAIKASDPFRDTSSSLTVEIGVMGDRARILEYIELGRPAGKRPPIEAIEQWIEDKGVLPEGVGIFTQRDLAFAIARKIGAEGTEGYHVFQRISEELENDSQLFNLFQAATDRIVAALNATQ